MAAASKDLTLAVVGSGWGTTVQTPAFARAGIRTSLVAGRTKERAAAAALAAVPDGSAEATDDMEACAASPASVVSIVTPPHTHLPLVKAAVAAGKCAILLCEKPTALSVAEAEAMAAAVRGGPVALIDHELRFLAAFRALRALVRTGALGPVRRVSAEVHRPGRVLADGGSGTVLASHNWWSEAAKGGGALGAIGSHMYDMMRFVTGASAVRESVRCALTRAHDERLTADGSAAPVTADDRADATFRLDSGAAAALVVSLASAGRAGFRFEVAGRDATAAYTGGRLEVFPHTGATAPLPGSGVAVAATTYFGAAADEDGAAPGPASGRAGSMPRNDFTAGTVQIARACAARLTGAAVPTGEAAEVDAGADEACDADADADAAARNAIRAHLRSPTFRAAVGDLSVMRPGDLEALGATFEDGVATQTFLDDCRAASAAAGYS